MTSETQPASRAKNGAPTARHLTGKAPIKQMQLMKFDGTNWRLFGDMISASSS
jgi:hypothetical protein